MFRPSPTFFALTLLVACVDAGRPGFRSSTELVRRAQTQAEAPAATLDQPRAPLPDVRFYPARRIDSDGDVTHTLVGPVRVDLRGGVATTAEDVPPEPIVTAARCARGWVFATRNAVYASPSFTGRLRMLRSFTCREAGERPEETVPTLHLGRDRVGITVSGEGAWWSDGATLHAVDGDDVVGVVWHDERWGARIDSYRTVRVTHDGGATWREVELQGALPMILHPRAEFIQVETGSTALRIDAHDVVSSAPRDASPTWGAADARCLVREALTEVMRAVAAQSYLIVRAEGAASDCAARHARIAPAWQPPGAVVRVEGVRVTDNDYAATLRVARPSGSPLGTLRSRAWADSAGAGAVVAVSGPDEPIRGSMLTFTWRGEDDAGSFSNRFRVRVPFGPFHEQWHVLTATRAGLLANVSVSSLSNEAPEPSPRPTLLWVTARGIQRVHEDSPDALTDLAAMPLAEGGAVVLGGFDVYGPASCAATQQVLRRSLVALQIGADGTVLWRRVMVDAPEFGVALGFVEVEGRWGVAFATRGHGDALVAQMLDQTTVSLGSWGRGTTARVCDGEARPTRLHVLTARDERLGMSVEALGREGEFAELAQAHVVTWENRDDGACLRAVRAERMGEGFELHEEDFRHAWEPLRLQARDGALVGVLDEGTRVDHVRATLHAPHER